MLARSFRYYVEGTLAVFFGKQVLLFMKDNGLVIVSIVATVALIALVVYIIVNRLRRKRAVTNQSG